MQNLNLPDREAIHFLINRISIPVLRGMAALLKADTINQLFEQMHNLAVVYSVSGRKSPATVKKTDKEKVKGPNSAPEKTSSTGSSSKNAYCVYCCTKVMYGLTATT